MQDISEIKKLRIKLNLTQKELGQKAGVSHKIDPSYSNAKKIFETLSMLDRKNQLTAQDIMYNKIISANYSDTLRSTIFKMRDNNISQMPVIKRNKVLGYISEKIILDKMIEGSEHDLRIGKIMETSPPIMPPNTAQGVIANLLKHFPFVLIEDRGNLIGIITKVDLLKAVYNHS